MKPKNAPQVAALQDKAFVVLVVAVSAAFFLTIWAFFTPIFWAAVLAILFSPVCRRLSRLLRAKRTVAALMTMAVILLIAILPAIIIASVLMQEMSGLYARMKAGELDFGAYLQQIMDALPAWVSDLLARFGLTDFASIQARVSAGLMKSVQFIGAHAISVGQNTLEFIAGFFIMLYLLFFLLRDGDVLSRRIDAAVPLDRTLRHTLAGKFTTVVRATIKGTIVIALIQGALGGLIFWVVGIHAPVFWGAVMAFLSLLPLVGTALVWIPAALYLLATGAIWQGVVLIAFCGLVIGLVDNVVRPMLVGNDTKLPDYVVLIATLGGMAAFGMNGFVIGPLVAAMFIAVWDVVAKSRTDAEPEAL